MHADRTPVTEEMRADLSWSPQFAHGWNGVSIPTIPHRTIEVDARMGGIGGADNTTAYSHQLQGTISDDPDTNINHLEALNAIVALFSMMATARRVMCDNQAAVHVLTTVRTHYPNGKPLRGGPSSMDASSRTSNKSLLSTYTRCQLHPCRCPQ